MESAEPKSFPLVLACVKKAQTGTAEYFDQIPARSL